MAKVLAKLEIAQSRYGLINKLNDLNWSQLDELYNLLDDWTLDMAKLVLNELQERLKLVDEMRQKIFDERTDEVHELQPLFHRGLWIFGPEFETIEFTSNEGMTKVIRKLFNNELTWSRNRPDFVIHPDGTVGFYYYPRYDKDGGENGVDRLVIVELKKPGIKISTDEKNQCWKYVTELYDKGLIQDQYSSVTCFVLGAEIDPNEAQERTEKNNAVRIIPLNYVTVFDRAKSRLLKLYDRVKDAPFLDSKAISSFLDGQSNSGSYQIEFSDITSKGCV